MDSFEQIVAMLLAREGYWTQTSYKVCLTKQEKIKISLPSCPRWESGKASRATHSAIRATVSVLLLVTMNHHISPCQSGCKTKTPCSIQSSSVPDFLLRITGPDQPSLLAPSPTSTFREWPLLLPVGRRHSVLTGDRLCP